MSDPMKADARVMRPTGSAVVPGSKEITSAAAVLNTYENALAYLSANGTTVPLRRDAIAERDAAVKVLPFVLRDAISSYDELRAAHADLIAERDALRAALKAMVASYDGIRDGLTCAVVLEKLARADAALLASEGK